MDCEMIALPNCLNFEAVHCTLPSRKEGERMKGIVKFAVILVTHVVLVALLAATWYVVTLNHDDGAAPARFGH
jgi:hypothetical protein